MSTYKEQDIENLLAHLREGIASDSVLALADDIRVDCEGAGDGESVWMHPVLPGARYGKEDKVIYDPFDTLPGRSLKSSGGLPMVEFYLHRGDDRPDATRNVKDMEPAPYLIGRYYMKTLLADHLGRGILLQDMPRLALSADTVLDVQDDLAKAVRAYAAGCDFEIDGADADIARCLAQGGGCAAGTKVSAVYVPVGDLPRETTIFPDMTRAAASIGLEDPETETLAEYGASPCRWSAPPMRRAASSSRTGRGRAAGRPRSSAAASSSSRPTGTARKPTFPSGRSRAPRRASPTPQRARSRRPPSS
ncbi:MAG: hypothetical protein ACLUUB_02435 [Collinsella sp.]